MARISIPTDALMDLFAVGATADVRFANVQRIDDQHQGVFGGVDAIERWGRGTSVWLKSFAAEPAIVATLSTPGRWVVEISFDIRGSEGRVDLPYVIVAELEGELVKELRTYHSTWPYTGGHQLRPPPLAGRTPETIPESFSSYVDQVERADVDAVLARFTEDGYLREPSGDRYRHQGPEGRAKLYGHLRHAPQTRFDLYTATEDGHLLAVEYGFAYGDSEVVGGICIMEFEGEQIAAVRITDDVGV